MTRSISRNRRAYFSSRRSILSLLALVAGTYRQRRALARLDDAALDDMGISRDEAMAEARRPIWDVPTTWRC
ncbi:DUF1127 domain-containing protein [Falsihalocynthiibacter sp. SS001]|uniref:DUF1127 domain-containing protein n=1 Tax=Falsihalocynthiibacter sp. SS001 TaxID=3349698 RepID=UPI0036D2EDB2